MPERRILLIVGGGIAAYKACELVRLIRKAGMGVTCVLTEGGARFITAMSLAALSENPVHTTLWDLKNEVEMGHIRLSREADLVVICPATANLMAKMAAGIADDLATTLLLATDKKVLIVPAMNVRMWEHPATQRNVAQLRADGITVMEPDVGTMACGEQGAGRLPEPEQVMRVIASFLTPAGALSGHHMLITAGPTYEAIDPVRYIANRSSGLQGFAIATAAARAGARVSLVAGPVSLPTPDGVSRIDIESAREMETAVVGLLNQADPPDIAVMVAAVADWRAETEAPQKLKKQNHGAQALHLVQNPDILAGLCAHPHRPALVIGFAAETEHMLDHARAKLISKQADWIIANDVSGSRETSVMGGMSNQIHIVTAAGIESLPKASKDHVAQLLVERICDAIKPY